MGVGEGAGGELRGRAAARVEPAVDAALHGRELSAEEVRRVGALVKARHEAVGYTDYAAWMAAHRAE